ncbi:MAG TPA: di-heme oxidoredictase family protein [Kofleriaceae bacterium]|nr:di-heme oxidoredictase family protein [Kofleriaceae bacterium]
MLRHTHRNQILTPLLSLGVALGAMSCDEPATSLEQTNHALTSTASGERMQGHRGVLHARVVATGIPGAGAIAEVGAFIPGSALHDVPEFAAFTQPGRVFDPRRLLVASTSSFGAPLARPGDAAGAILSIDPSSDAVAVPPDFAASGTQASAQGGAVQLYTAQSPLFGHPPNTPATTDFTSVGLPTGISLNNGGRPWFSSATTGSAEPGTVSITNPDGRPIAVFAGDLTNHGTTTHGLSTAALGLAFLTKAPDAAPAPVFAAVTADGSVVQVHSSKGVDGLAPPGTITPIAGVSRTAAESTAPGVVTRAGVVFNWAPTSNLVITDPLADRLVIVDIADDGQLFTAPRIRAITADELDIPIDAAPTTREVADANFNSNTMLGAGADLYVLNRGNNTIVRMRLDGKVTAVRAIDAPVPGFRVNGICVSSDNQVLYVTATAPGQQGLVLAMPAFGASDTTEQLIAAAHAAGATDMTSIGATLFSLDMTPTEGLGPLYNAQSCASCHGVPFPGGMGVTPDAIEHLEGRLGHDGTFRPLHGHRGPAARAHSIAELGFACNLPTGPAPEANVISPRNTMTLRGDGLIEAIRSRDILANQALEPAAVRGRPNLLADGRIGKFGWKANVATLVEFMGDAYRNELGITNPISPIDEVHGCGARAGIEMDDLPLTAVTAFMNTLDPPAPSPACLGSSGAALFQSVGCASCHTPALPGRGSQVRLYSDLLLHDMGPGLADQMQQESATGSEWRTMPLWRLSERQRFLHDGRATTPRAAIAEHGGQAAAARAAFDALDAAGQQALLDFLNCI